MELMFLAFLYVIEYNSANGNNECTNYTEWDPVLNRCKDCPADSKYNESVSKCIYPKDVNINCDAGYQWDPSRKKCSDINECKQNVDVCQINEYCKNLQGSFKCVVKEFCGQGYEFNTTTERCIDINECQQSSKYCGSNMVCENVMGSFTCRKPCPTDKSFYWSSACHRCKEGHRFNRATNQCEDVDECVGPYKLICEPFKEICVKMPGLSKCVTHCSGGTIQMNDVCYDIDECFEKKHNCTPAERCDNYYGYFKCEDIDECDNFYPVCGTHGKCVNIIGGYQCQCDHGYRFNNGTCVDIDECVTLKGICGHLQCQNIPGDFLCVCRPGFKMINGSVCEDINECIETPQICQNERFSRNEEYRCFNLIGSFKCIQSNCPTEYRNLAESTDSQICKLTDTKCSFSNNRECFRILAEKLIYKVIEIRNSATFPLKIGDIEIDDLIFDHYYTYIVVKKSMNNKTKEEIDITDSIILQKSKDETRIHVYVIADLPDSTEIVLEISLKTVQDSVEKMDLLIEMHIFINNDFF